MGEGGDHTVRAEVNKERGVEEVAMAKRLHASKRDKVILQGRITVAVIRPRYSCDYHVTDHVTT